MHAKSGGSSGEPPDFLFIPAACRSRKDLPRSAGGGDRARNAGYRLRNAEDAGTGTGRRRRGCGATGTERRAAGPRVRVRGAGAEHGRRGRGAQDAKRGTRGRGRGHGHGGTGARGAGRRTQNAEHGLLAAGSRTRETRARARGAGDGRRGTGDGAQETGHKPPCMERNATAYAPPGPATTGLDRSQPGAIRRRDQSAGTFHGWTPAAGTRNNPPGPFTAGRHPPPEPATTCRDRSQPGAIRRGPHPTCRAYESESRRCRRARRTCCCRAAPRPT